MQRVYIFADEAGDMTFRATKGISDYFYMVTVATAGDCAVGDQLMELRRELAWHGKQIEAFHAKNDRDNVRYDVYDLIAASGLRIDATIVEKRKTQDHLRVDQLRFYKQTALLHYKYVVPMLTSVGDQLFVSVSSLTITRKKKRAVQDAIHDVIAQCAHGRRFVTTFVKNETDPCLQLADYAAWAIQRKYESGDTRYYDRIAHRVTTEFQPFRNGPTKYY